MELRPHQEDMIEKIEAEIMFGGTKIIVDACPAYGKSLLMSEVANRFKDDGVIILINISALLDQISYHLTEQGVDHSILKADKPKDFDPSKKVQLVMAQTLHARLSKIKFDHKFKIYQQDEMHRENPELSQRSMDCVAYLEPEVVIGYSGTPYDSLGFKFDNYEYLFNVHAKDLQDQGYLCPIKYYVPKWAEMIDYSNVKKSGIDYNNYEIEKIINTNEHMSLVVDAMNQMNAKSKKTIVFCTSIEQADKLALALKTDGYHAESYHSKTEYGARIIDAFINNSTYSLAPNQRDAKLFDDEVYEEFPVRCIVSINKLGIGFDSPDIQLAVQTRPTKVRSLFVQQVMRAARKHPSKQYAEYLDLAQTVSSFGFHTDIYNPPSRTGIKHIDNKALEEANSSALEDVKAILTNELVEITRERYELRVEEINRLMKKKELKDLSIQDLAAAFEISKDHKEIIKIATLIYTYKFGKPISKAGTPYNYHPESFWSTSFFGDNERFHVVKSMDEYFELVPEKKSMWIKALKTRCRNIIKTGDKLFKITGFIQFMYEKHIADTVSIVDEYRKDQSSIARFDANDTIEQYISEYDDYDLDEVPF